MPWNQELASVATARVSIVTACPRERRASAEQGQPAAIPAWRTARSGRSHEMRGRAADQNPCWKRERARHARMISGFPAP